MGSLLKDYKCVHCKTMEIENANSFGDSQATDAMHYVSPNAHIQAGDSRSQDSSSLMQIESQGGLTTDNHDRVGQGNLVVSDDSTQGSGGGGPEGGGSQEGTTVIAEGGGKLTQLRLLQVAKC